MATAGLFCNRLCTVEVRDLLIFPCIFEVYIQNSKKSKEKTSDKRSNNISPHSGMIEMVLEDFAAVITFYKIQLETRLQNNLHLLRPGKNTPAVDKHTGQYDQIQL
jgi:hypothetical protein